MIFQFLSLGDQTSLHIKRLVLDISHRDLQNEPQQEGSINLIKLKKSIEQMGDCVSDRAKDFFSTMEQFQQVRFSFEIKPEVCKALKFPFSTSN